MLRLCDVSQLVRARVAGLLAAASMTAGALRYMHCERRGRRTVRPVVEDLAIHPKRDAIVAILRNYATTGREGRSSFMQDSKFSAAVFFARLHGWSLAALVVLGTAGCGRKTNVVNPDAALDVGAKFWQALRVNDVSASVDMYASRVWSTDPNARARWSRFLSTLNEKYGAVSAVELKQKKWFPGSKLVADHRPFVCYAYDYAVTRGAMLSQERLIACAEPDVQASIMPLYGHRITRLDTQQTVAVGIDVEEKPISEIGR